MHALSLERCEICHENTTTMTKAEDHNTLKSNVLNILESHEELSNALEIQRQKFDLISTALFRAFLHGFYASTHDRQSSSHSNSHALNHSTHYRPDITLHVSELRDTATKKRNKVTLNSS